jgi:hypothetical protein
MSVGDRGKHRGIPALKIREHYEEPIMRLVRTGTLLTLLAFALPGCGGSGPATGMPTAEELANAPTGPPPDAGAAPPRSAVLKNSARYQTYSPARRTSRL